MTALGRADAMGLLPRDERIERLDLASMRKAVRHIHRAGIARSVGVGLGETGGKSPGLEGLLETLNRALEESPAPEFEWDRLAEILGIDLVARLVGISATSVRRYRASARTTPDPVAAKLHFLTMIVGDLGGAYNEIGIRQWFDRKRAQLGGRAPAALLGKSWPAAGEGPSRVRELARALTSSPVT